MVLRSRPHPTVNNTDSINTRYTPSSTPDTKTESINTRYTTSSTEEVPEDGLHGNREKSLGRNDNEAAELQRSSPYNLRLRERKRKTSEGERGTGSQTQKAAKKDESSSGKEHCTPRFTSFEKNCFSAWASTLNMGLINKVDMVCLSPVGYGV